MTLVQITAHQHNEYFVKKKEEFVMRTKEDKQFGLSRIFCTIFVCLALALVIGGLVLAIDIGDPIPLILGSLVAWIPVIFARALSDYRERL